MTNHGNYDKQLLTNNDNDTTINLDLSPLFLQQVGEWRWNSWCHCMTHNGTANDNTDNEPRHKDDKPQQQQTTNNHDNATINLDLSPLLIRQAEERGWNGTTQDRTANDSKQRRKQTTYD